MTAIGLAHLMAEALGLAERGRFRVEPNPCVGAVVVDAGGEVVGRGFHAAWGGPHAEVAALAEAGGRARGGTLVVTLEPCAHTAKKTPPCVPALIAAGVSRVVAGTADPNVLTTGHAAWQFSAAGVSYECGIDEDRCKALIARYERHVRVLRPWTVAKWASSLDGRTADSAGGSRWISSQESRAFVHVLRGSVDALIVGRGTIVSDDPMLTARPPGSSACRRVVLDTELRTSPEARVVTTAADHPTIFVCANDADASRSGALKQAGVLVVEVARGSDGHLDVREALHELYGLGVRRALLEGGCTLSTACMQAGLVDQVAAFVAPVVIGGGGPTPFAGDGWPIGSAPRLEEVRVTPIGPDALIEGYWPSGSNPSPV